MAEIEIPSPPATFWQGFRYCRDPRLLWHHFRYARQRVAFVAALTGVSPRQAEDTIAEIEGDHDFLAQVLGKRHQVLGHPPHGTDFMYLSGGGGSHYFFVVALYAVLRLLKPGLVVETGGTPGSSSAFILRALDRNKAGQLITVDLPFGSGAEDGESPQLNDWRAHYENTPSGWIIPDGLRGRHRPELGDAKQVLPAVLADVETIDVFIHDSDHSYEHMMWEFRQAWPFIRPGGLLMSDDIRANQSFDDFARSVGTSSYKLGNLGAVTKRVVG